MDDEILSTLQQSSEVDKVFSGMSGFLSMIGGYSDFNNFPEAHGQRMWLPSVRGDTNGPGELVNLNFGGGELSKVIDRGMLHARDSISDSYDNILRRFEQYDYSNY